MRFEMHEERLLIIFPLKGVEFFPDLRAQCRECASAKHGDFPPNHRIRAASELLTGQRFARGAALPSCERGSDLGAELLFG